MIFAPIYYTPASVLLKNAKDMGYDVKMMGCDGWTASWALRASIPLLPRVCCS
ncbi:MAG: hypothetical protein ACLU0O_09590 [Collinsella sp.]